MQSLSRASLIFLFLAVAGILSAAEKIDINTAPLEDLIKIIHIGGTRAEELISLRPFSSLDDLDRIKGIGDSRIADIKKQGLAWVDEYYKIEVSPQSDKGLAAVGEQIPKNLTSRSSVLIALAMAAFSGIMILILKKKLT